MSRTASDPPETALAVLSPFDLSRLGTVARHDAADLERMRMRAAEVFADRDRRPGPERRHGVLQEVADALEARAGAFARTAAGESGKTLREAAAEVRLAVDHLRAAAAAILSAAGRTAPAPGAGSHLVLRDRRAGGAVVAGGSFRDPLGSAVRGAASAFAAGCPVVLRPAPETPLSCLALVELFAAAGAPEPWIQAAVTGEDAPAEAGDDGATAVAVAGDADVYEARDTLLRGCFRHAGQAHGSVRRVFAHTSLATRLATQLAMKASGLRVGDPLGDGTEIGPLIRPEATERVDRLVREAVDGGGQLLTGGQRLTDTLYAPTVIFNPPPDCRAMTGRASGPAVCVAPWFDRDDLLARVNRFPAPRAAVLARDIAAATGIAAAVDADTVLINDHTAFPPGALPSATAGAWTCDRSAVVRWIDDLRADRTIAIAAVRPPPPDAEPA